MNEGAAQARRAQTQAGQAAPMDADRLEAGLVAVIRALLAELNPAARPPRIALDSDLVRDLALDSLGRAELLLRLSRRFHVALPDRLIGEAATPAELLAAIRAAGPAPQPAQEPQPEAPAPALPTAEEPLQAATLLDALAFHVGLHPDRPHLRLCPEPGREAVVTYAELDRSARRVAAGLVRHGLVPGGRVAVMLPTGPAFFAAFFGALIAGGVPVPLYPPFQRARIADHLERQVRILANAAPEHLIASEDIAAFARLLPGRVPSLRHVLTPEAFAALPPLERAVPAAPETTALIQYTSGSTGDPKGVVLTHANLLANVRAMGAAIAASSSDVVVSWLPLYHDMGLIGCWLGSLYFGALAVILPPLSFLADPGRWLRAIERHSGTISAAPNFAFERCLKALRDEDLSGLDLGSLRVLTNGAEPVSADTLARFEARFAAFGLRKGVLAPVYGLAECAVGLAFPPPGRAVLVDRIDRDALSRRGVARPAGEGAAAIALVACGRPLPGHQIRVVDADGREVAERVEGRLQFKGPSATAGYFRNPEKTRALFDGDWLESGDLAYLASGDVYITGRTKDIIIRAGRKIYPQELEEIAGTVPGVRKGCVVAFESPDPDTGTERLILAAETRVTDPGAQRDLSRMLAAAAARVLEQPPDTVLLCPPHAVPKTSSGKIRRSAARALYESGGLERPASRWRTEIVPVALAGLHALSRRAGEVAYAAWWWTLLTATGLVLWPLVLLLPRRAWRHAALRSGARTFLRAAGMRPEVTGSPPVPGRPAILAANHASYLDAAVLAAILPGSPAFLAKHELAGQALAGPFLRRLGTAFVHRGAAEGVAETQALLERLHGGERIVAFPEGTFTRRPGLAGFHLGAFLAACQAGVPVIPLAITGTRSILRADQWFPRRGAIRVVVGAPLAPDGDDFHAAIRLRDATRAAILSACGEPDLADDPAAAAPNAVRKGPGP
ncbi:AMP-binding protein [Methylobacterium sp. Leaf123]|uniref:AMP-binding protein n=1 Tax=Methylobacterium sp. Leaf123 TaxID=1736264 RepID=UPI000AD9A67F|nr:AMP-binding protein [Methylobacterium sp. Leaf123]